MRVNTYMRSPYILFSFTLTDWLTCFQTITSASVSTLGLIAPFPLFPSYVQISTVIPTMASIVDANDVERLVSHCQLCSINTPDFLDVLVEEAEDNLTYETTHKDLLLKDWITPGLSTTEIISFFPTAEQIDKSNETRDLEGCKTKCLQLFPVGRIFASHKPVEQAAKFFLDAWAISSSCSYLKPPSC
jgi:hypothetical protein